MLLRRLKREVGPFWALLSSVGEKGSSWAGVHILESRHFQTTQLPFRSMALLKICWDSEPLALIWQVISTNGLQHEDVVLGARGLGLGPEDCAKTLGLAASCKRRAYQHDLPGQQLKEYYARAEGLLKSNSHQFPVYVPCNVCIFMCIHVYKHIHICIYIYTCVYTYIHMYVIIHM